MKICLVGNYYRNGVLDEGMSNVGFYLYRELSKRHSVLHPSVKHLFRGGFWKTIKDFQPQIIHYIPGTSIRNLLLVKMLKSYCSGAKVISSVQQRGFSPFSRLFIPLLSPDLVLVHSLESERMFASSGCKTEFIPNGVDTQRFMPVSSKDRRQLKLRYKIDEDKFTVLHIGPIRRWRNANTLARIQKESDFQVMVVASTTNPSEQDACDDLRRAGCLVWKNYFENIEDIYALSGCYVFPVSHRRGSIETPLSVMEAMSCDLPTISTRYGALPRMFQEGDGLCFVDSEEDFIPLLKEVKAGNVEVKTREKVLPYSWETIVTRLERVYRELLQ